MNKYESNNIKMQSNQLILLSIPFERNRLENR